MEQHSRHNVIIDEVPAKEDENVESPVKEVASKLKVDIPDYGLIAAHRLPREAQVPAIIVKLYSRKTEAKLIKDSKTILICLNDKRLNWTPGLLIFCDKHLTQCAENLLLRRPRNCATKA